MSLRKSKVVKEILSLLTEAKNPISVPQILKKVKANKTTIYRDLYKLVAEDKINELDFGERVKLYEISNLSHHHHLICTNCKKVLEIKVDDISLVEIESRLKMQTGFDDVKHSLEFYGVCSDCV